MSDYNKHSLFFVIQQFCSGQARLVVLVMAALFFTCNSPYIPKQEGYFKISLPEKKYITFNEPSYPYTFEYPVYAQIVKDTTFFDSIPENPYWINVDFPQFAGRIYMSYKSVGGKYKLEQLVNDAYKMTNKHTIKASGIDDSLIHPANNVSGVFFKVEGDVATANQFFVTDSTHNFLRGALYFDATPNEDSLRPVNDFLVTDMKHLINTFHWK
jgi:gliding motility-associated lipoprotein GldD